MHTYTHLCKSLSIYPFGIFLIFAAPFEEIEEEADEDISWDLREDPPPRVSAPPMSDGVRHEEPMPIFAEVPSERLLGENRREKLKSKAEHLSRSLCESFSFVASKTMSIKDTMDVIQTFGNVSWLDQASLLLFYSISSENM